MKNLSMKVKLSAPLLLLSLFASEFAAAAICTSLSSGAWNNTARWSCGAVPGNADDVTIATGHNVTTPGGATTVNSMAINALAILTDGGGNFTVNTTLAVNGIWAGAGAGRLQMNSGNTLSGVGIIDNEQLRFTGANVIAAGTNLLFTGANRTIDIRNNTTVTNNGTITIGRMVGQSASSVWTNAANSVLNVSNDLLVTGTLNASAAGNTVNYNGAAQTVKAPNTATYYNLTLSGTDIKTMPAIALTISGNFTMSGAASPAAATATSTLTQPLTVNGNFTLNADTIFNAGTPIHTVRGNFTNSGTLNASTGEFRFNGAAAQSLTGATTFYNFTADNNSGITLNNDTTVGNFLLLTNGLITTGTNSLISTGSCTVSVTRTNGWVAGTLRKATPVGTPVSCIWEIGDATIYRPVTLNFASVTVAGNVAAWISQAAGDHPNTTGATSGVVATQSVNRYWTLTASGGLVFTTTTATFTYDAGDLDVGAVAASFVVARGTTCTGTGAARTCATWASTTPGVAPTTTQTVVGGVFGFGDFAIGTPANGNFAREPELIYSREVY